MWLRLLGESTKLSKGFGYLKSYIVVALYLDGFAFRRLDPHIKGALPEGLDGSFAGWAKLARSSFMQGAAHGQTAWV